IINLNFLGEHVVVLHSQQASTDVLEKNMNVYSNRPRNMVMGAELSVAPCLLSRCRLISSRLSTVLAGIALLP
ncbi:hypothetical protein BD414DRAFT_426845, partial [Trametes punicea]